MLKAHTVKFNFLVFVGGEAREGCHSRGPAQQEGVGCFGSGRVRAKSTAKEGSAVGRRLQERVGSQVLQAFLTKTLPQKEQNLGSQHFTLLF